MEVKYTDTITSIFSKIVAEKPDEIAVVYQENIITYGELDKVSDYIANNLIDKGIKAGSIIGVCMTKNIAFITTILGIMKAGCAYLPMDTIYPKNRLKRMAEIAEVSATILQDSLMEEKFSDISLTFTYETLKKENTKNQIYEVNQKDLAYIIFTSGSTGEPKGISIRHESVVNLVDAMTQILNTDLKCVGCVAPIVFDMSVGQIYYALLMGCKLCLVPDSIKIYPDQLIAYIEKNKIELCDFTPTHLQMLLNVMEMNHTQFKSIKEIISAGEALPLALAQKTLNTVLKDSGRIANLYGPSEACVYATAFVIDHMNCMQLTQMKIGKPLKNIQIHIVNEQGSLCQMGEVGELCISGVAVANGYYNNEELTKKAFVKGFYGQDTMYRTGDSAKWDEFGDVIYLGRQDSQVKIRGYRIELSEIEYQIAQIQGIRQARVIVKEQAAKKMLLAYYIGDSQYEDSDICEKLSKVLPQYMIPDACIRVEKFELTLNGKLDVSKLPSFELDQELVFDNCKISNIDEMVRKLCSKVLNRTEESISLEDNFFIIGGNSYNIIELCVEINNVYGISLNLAEMYRQKDLAGIAQIIQKASKINKCEEPKDNCNVPATWFHKTILHNESLETKRKYNQTGILFPAYNVVHKISLNRQVDANKLESAIRNVILYYGAFYTTFYKESNEYYMQVDNEKRNYEFFSYVTNEKDLNDQTLRKYAKVFDVTELPLFQVVLFENDKEQVIMLNIHHGIFDYFSMKLFMTKVFENYMGKPFRENYKDYAAYVNQYLEEDKSEYFLFWKKYYGHRLPCAFFESDKGMGRFKVKKTDSFSQLEQYIDEHRVQKLRTMCIHNGISEYVFLISSFALLLGKYSKMNDVILGTYVPGRNAINGNVIGLFTQMIGIRLQYEDSMTFLEFAKKQQENIANVMKNQYVEVYQIYRSLAYEDLMKGELFSIIYNYVNDISLDIDEVHIKSCEIGDEPEHLPFSLKAFSSSHFIRINAVYCDALYSPEYINRIFNHYFVIIDYILNNEGEQVSIKNVQDAISQS